MNKRIKLIILSILMVGCWINLYSRWPTIPEELPDFRILRLRGENIEIRNLYHIGIIDFKTGCKNIVMTNCTLMLPSIVTHPDYVALRSAEFFINQNLTNRPLFTISKCKFISY